MKNKFRILYLLCAVLAFTSCEEDKLLTYDTEANIFFRQKKWIYSASAYTVSLNYEGKAMSINTRADINQVIDSVQVSMAFVQEELRSDTTFLPVSIMGDLSPEKRPINFEIISVGDSREAVEGVNFRVLDAYIPANRRDGGIVIEMFRDGFETDEIKTVDIRLLPNEHFGTNYKVINRSNTDTTKVSTLTMKLLFTDGLQQGKWAESFFGTWSTKKVYVLVYELGMPWDFLYDNTQLDRFVAAAYGNALKKWLQNYKDTHDGTPYYEADGETEMTAGSSTSI